MARNKHIHVYKRVLGHKTMFMCIRPECRHTSYKNLMVGKEAICRYCVQKYILKRSDLRKANPHCGKCDKGKKIRPSEQQVIELIKDM